MHCLRFKIGITECSSSLKVGFCKLSSHSLQRKSYNSTALFSSSGIPYHLHITTGDMRNASTNAKVYVILHGGEDGENNSGKLWLQNDKKDNFERGRTDIFSVETTEMLSPLHHLTIGHDNSGLGAGWYCEKVQNLINLSLKNPLKFEKLIRFSIAQIVWLSAKITSLLRL